MISRRGSLSEIGASGSASVSKRLDAPYRSGGIKDVAQIEEPVKRGVRREREEEWS